jgi:integrase
MGAATFKVVLAAQAKTDGTRRVTVRVTKNRAVRFVPSGFYVLPAHFNKAGSFESPKWIRSGNTQAGTLNTALLRLLNGGRAYALGQPNADAEEIAGHVRALAVGSDDAPELVDFFAFAAQDVAGRKSINTGKAIRDTFRAVRKWWGPKPLPVAIITRGTLQKFEEWSRADVASLNSVGTRVRLFISTYRRAVLAGLVPAGTADPFVKYPIPKQAAEKAALTQTELAALIGAKLSTPAQQIARDVWLAQFYLFGARISDIVQLKTATVSGNGRARITQSKTGKLIDSPIPPALAERLAPYLSKPNGPFVFPLLPAGFDNMSARGQWQSIQNARNSVGKLLPAVEAAAGLRKHLTTHVARHTFASLVYEATKDVRVVQSMLGHSSVTITELYLASITTAATDRAAELVYGAVAEQQKRTTAEQQNLPSTP